MKQNTSTKLSVCKHPFVSTTLNERQPRQGAIKFISFVITLFLGSMALNTMAQEHEPEWETLKKNSTILYAAPGDTKKNDTSAATLSKVRVGIGTANPLFPLDVKGTVSSDSIKTKKITADNATIHYLVTDSIKTTQNAALVVDSVRATSIVADTIKVTTLSVDSFLAVKGLLKIGDSSMYLSSFNQSGVAQNSMYTSGDLLLQSGGGYTEVQGSCPLCSLVTFTPANTVINSGNFGSVMIGKNTSPISKLDVFGGITSSFLAPANSTTLTSADGIVIANASGTMYKKRNFSGIATDVLHGDGSWSQVTGGGNSNAWNLTGNNLTNDLLKPISPFYPNEFIGTTNNYDWIVRTNNFERMRITAADGNMGIGTGLFVAPNTRLHIKGVDATSNNFALQIENTANPPLSLFTVRNDGLSTAYSITSQRGLSGHNEFFGEGAGKNQVGLSENTAVGYFTLNRITAGVGNSGRGNTAIGYVAGQNITTGYFNTLIGYGQGLNITTGIGNTIIGGANTGIIDGSNNIILVVGTGAPLQNPSTSNTFAVAGGGMRPVIQSSRIDDVDGTTNIFSNLLIDRKAYNIATVQSAQTQISSHSLTFGGIYWRTNIYNYETFSFQNIASTTFNDFGRLAITGFRGIEAITILGAGDQSPSPTRNGFVGIGTTATSLPTERLDVRGNIIAAGSITPSDRRLKTNIDTISNALKIVTQLRGVYYKLDTTKIVPVMYAKIDSVTLDTTYYHLPFDTSRKVGLIAQDVEKVLPEVVSKDDSGYYRLDYSRFVPVLVEGIKILAARDSAKDVTIDSLKTAIGTKDSALEARVRNLEALVAQCCSSSSGEYKMSGNNSSTSSNTTVTKKEVELKFDAIVLDQNNPNPFKETTTINYFIPAHINYAQIIFYDITGRIIKTVDINEKGQGQLNVKAENLSSGIYTYSIVVDGNIIDSKKMLKSK